MIATVAAIVSGGMDSVTLLYKLANNGMRVIVISFDYGQRHSRELECAAKAASVLAFDHHIIKLPFGDLVKGSALTDSSVSVPHGHYEAESMKATIVPNRNLTMLSIAAMIGIANGADTVATAVHAGDHAIYPDCRPAFIKAAQEAIRIGTDTDFRILAPFVEIRKEEIVKIGAELGVPFADTWSCYEGGDVHCGRCGTCVERRESFELAGVPDPTVYAG